MDRDRVFCFLLPFVQRLESFEDRDRKNRRVLPQKVEASREPGDKMQNRWVKKEKVWGHELCSSCEI